MRAHQVAQRIHDLQVFLVDIEILKPKDIKPERPTKSVQHSRNFLGIVSINEIDGVSLKGLVLDHNSSKGLREGFDSSIHPGFLKERAALP